jgi:hypothetical protein
MLFFEQSGLGAIRHLGLRVVGTLVLGENLDFAVGFVAKEREKHFLLLRPSQLHTAKRIGRGKLGG